MEIIDYQECCDCESCNKKSCVKVQECRNCVSYKDNACFYGVPFFVKLFGPSKTNENAWCNRFKLVNKNQKSR